MNFKIDENLPVEMAHLLRAQGYDAMTVVEQGLGGEVDTRVAEICQSEQRVLVTLDTDFSDNRIYRPSEFAGLIVFRLRKQDKPSLLSAMKRLLDPLRSEPLQGRLWIVGENRIRVRRVEP